MACIVGYGQPKIHIKVAANGGVNGTCHHGHTEHIVETTFSRLRNEVYTGYSVIFITEADAYRIGVRTILTSVRGRLVRLNIVR